MKKLTLLHFSVLVISLLTITPAIAQSTFPIGYVSEPYLRRYATKIVTPGYPEEAKQDGAQGLVIAAVRFNEEGDLEKVKVLESPHPLITEAVIEALKQWRCPRKDINGQPFRPQGVLRFSYVIRDGQGIVESLTFDEQRKPSDLYKKATYNGRRPDGPFSD